VSEVRACTKMVDVALVIVSSDIVTGCWHASVGEFKCIITEKK
jgi:hypothetical protein